VVDLSEKFALAEGGMITILLALDSQSPALSAGGSGITAKLESRLSHSDRNVEQSTQERRDEVLELRSFRNILELGSESFLSILNRIIIEHHCRWIQTFDV
jgi:hypothetical protein